MGMNAHAENIDFDPRAEIERLKEELRQEHDMYLRVLADCDNYRKRVSRDQAKVIRSGKRDLILGILETLDEFERAFKHAEQESESLLQGVELIYRLLKNRISAEGVLMFRSKGEMFDPKLHEAIGSVSGGQYKHGIIMEEVRSGYRWGDDILRPARVIVAQ
jgi:molecular chaperone GrpE